MHKNRLIVGITGASGPHYGIRTLELLKELPEIETHLVYSRAAVRVIQLETDLSLEDVRALADYSYRPEDIAAPLSSGSFQTIGMIIAPCSMGTVGCLANSVTKDLLTRAADVILKERKPLVILPRESPLHLGHLRSLTELAEMGALIAPPIPAFYHSPKTIDDLINHSLGRALELFGIQMPWLRRWEGPEDRGPGR